MTDAALIRHHEVIAPPARAHERTRGRWGMWLFIATEATLFALLFFAYFFLGASRPEWPPREDPSYTIAMVLLGILIVSSVATWLGERAIKRGSTTGLVRGIGIALLLACAFVALQVLEYREHLKHFGPTTDAYGSIFYTITSFHLAHLLLGMLMLGFVLARAFAGHFDRERHLAVTNAALYWHFVDVVWALVVLVLYISPRLYA